MVLEAIKHSTRIPNGMLKFNTEFYAIACGTRSGIASKTVHDTNCRWIPKGVKLCPLAFSQCPPLPTATNRRTLSHPRHHNLNGISHSHDPVPGGLCHRVDGVSSMLCADFAAAAPADTRSAHFSLGDDAVSWDTATRSTYGAHAGHERVKPVKPTGGPAIMFGNEKVDYSSVAAKSYAGGPIIRDASDARAREDALKGG
jgi:hypothetical protein